MRVLKVQEMRRVKGGATADCTSLQAAIFVAMSLLQFEVAAALAVTYALLCGN